MSNCCKDGCELAIDSSARYRRVLSAALWINALMFAVEIVGGMRANSVALLADAVDFAGDAANYGISLAVLSMGILWRSRAAWVKGSSMAAYGIFVISKSVWDVMGGVVPEAATMGAVAALALLANVVVAALLYAFRDGDANMRSVWLCSRNDAIGNVAVMIAAFWVHETASGWPDVVVALVMGSLALHAGISVAKQAGSELAQFRRANP